MFFDTDDLDLLESFEDLLDEVAIHEMGHVMGIGIVWSFQELLADAVGGRRHGSAFHRRPGHRRVRRGGRNILHGAKKFRWRTTRTTGPWTLTGERAFWTTS